MIYGSVCSGIEAASVAWHPLGWQAAFVSEIEAFPRAVLSERFPEIPLHGDFTTIGADDYRAIDLLVGGTPCQDFSIAGRGAGLDGHRGNLTLEYLRLAQRLRARWLAWENVPGVLSRNGGRDFGAILGLLAELGYGFAYRVLDAQYFGVPQRRRRVILVGYLGDWRRAAAVLFERSSLRRDHPPSRETAEGNTVGTLGGTSPGGGWRVGADEAAAGQLIPTIAATLGTASHDWNRSDPGQALIAFDTTQITSAANFSNPKPGAPCHPLAAGAHPPAIAGASIRRLTPRECELLQGFPDDYTLVRYRNKPAADGPRYKALGNSMAVPVMAWIGRRIEVVEAVINARSIAA